MAVLVSPSSAAGNRIFSAMAAASFLTAPDRAASMCSSSQADRSTGRETSTSSGSGIPRAQKCFPGSFGSAYMYYVVPKVILFRLEHTRRTLVEKVDFISAPGTSPANVYRPGGPIALVTSRCLFAFDRTRGRFRLASVHPGHTAEEIAEQTGFDFERADGVPETPIPSAETLRILRTVVAPQLVEVYPQFAAEVFGVEHDPEKWEPVFGKDHAQTKS